MKLTLQENAMAFDFSNKFGLSRVVGLLAVLALTAVFAVQMVGQSIVTGDVAGTVTDPSNAVVSGANVTLTSIDTNSSESATTNSTGFYRFPLVKPGNYK